MAEEQAKKSYIKEYGQPLAVALAIAFFVRLFFLGVFTIPSGSMLQTIQLGDFIFLNKLSYGFKLPFSGTWVYKGEGPEHGDIVVFKYPVDRSIDYIKRVVGVPGDVVEMRNKVFYRNGQPVKEDYVQHTKPNYIGPLDNFGPFTVPDDAYFMMGDNRDNSSDSRVWGTVPSKDIYGKAWRIYWSWDSETHSPRFSRLFKKLQ
ncbi:MAG: signal peptidase I [Mailhella sp.]|nr:signal peptidase I [Mailhella sp.]